MNQTLYKHQQKFIDLNPNKALCAFEAGTGKTLTAVMWLKQGRDDGSLVICPKRIVKKWNEELKKSKVKDVTVVTKEQFKKLIPMPWTALVIDEAHYHAAPLFTKGRSQLAEHTYELIKSRPSMPVLLLTATPICSNPANLHTLLCYIGVYTPWPKWRDYFYDLVRRPYVPRPFYEPKKDWRQRIRPILLKHAHVALMADCADYLPPVTEEVVKTPYTPLKVNPEWEPMAAFVAEHRNEQRQKGKVIRELGEGYRKVMVVAHFREQIDELEKELSKDKKTYVLHGGTKDQEAIIKQAQEDDECYFIVQGSIGVGFDADTFSVMIFASQSYSYVSSVQMRARIRRIHALKPVKYIYLQSGRIDKAVYARLQLGKNFDVAEFTKNS